jgi:hypothetical protein
VAGDQTRNEGPAVRVGRVDTKLDGYTVIGVEIAENGPTMNAPLLPEVLLGMVDDQAPLPLSTEGVLRYVWQSRFGAMLIEVHDGAAFINGQRVMSLAELRRDLAVNSDG